MKTLLKSVHVYQSYCKKNLAQFFLAHPVLYAYFCRSYASSSEIVSLNDKQAEKQATICLIKECRQGMQINVPDVVYKQFWTVVGRSCVHVNFNVTMRYYM